MKREQPLKIKGTFDDVLTVAGKYTPKEKAEKPGRKKAVKKAAPKRKAK
jgi:hypothetical protein